MFMTLTRNFLFFTAALSACSNAVSTAPEPWEPGCESPAFQCQSVAGSGVHLFTSAMIHSIEPTGSGHIQRSTDIIELSGDLEGRVLYQPVSVFDFTAGTLVNTGNQVFSGTVFGSEPVMIHDDTFRFEVDLATGATVGTVEFDRVIAGPHIQCWLDVVGTGMTPEGDALVDYTGVCRITQPVPATNSLRRKR